MISAIRTLSELNQTNRRFWQAQRELFAQRMANEPIREAAFDAFQAQTLRGVPTANRTPLEQLLEQADKDGRRFSRARALMGGTAKKVDALQILICDILMHRPHISANRLLTALKDHRAIHPIEDVDESTIYFTDPDGRSKEAPISGLKDRLTRAKKKLKSR